MMKRIAAVILVFCIYGSGSLFGKDDKKSEDANRNSRQNESALSATAFPIGTAFISRISSSDLFKRDLLITSRLGVLVESTAVVRIVEDYRLYRKRYRIVALMEPVGGVTIQYHIYTDNAEYLTFLSGGQKFAFKGQLAMMTPVNSKRDLYILDIILQEGAAIVE
jgi:hypothetical protein